MLSSSEIDSMMKQDFKNSQKKFDELNLVDIRFRDFVAVMLVKT